MVNKALEYLADGTVTLKKVHSPLNGELVVKWDFASGYQILGGGLWQVGGPVENVWRVSLSHLSDDFLPESVLILGLGGGSIAKLVRKRWKDTYIKGVDLDPVIVELGEKYLGLKKFKVDTVIGDAYDFVGKEKQKYSLICLDTYVEDTFPEKFDSEEFIKKVKKLLSAEGILLVNRLYYGKHTAKAEKFRKKLELHFASVKEIVLRDEANIVYLCQA